MKKVGIILLVIITIALAIVCAFLVFKLNFIESEAKAREEAKLALMEENEDTKERNENGLPIDEDGLITDENYPIAFNTDKINYYKVVQEGNTYLKTTYDDYSGILKITVSKNDFGIKKGDYDITGIDAEEVVEIEYGYYSEDSDKVNSIYLLTRSGDLYKISALSISGESVKAKKIDEGVYRMDTRLVEDTKEFYERTTVFVIKSDGTFYELKK